MSALHGLKRNTNMVSLANSLYYVGIAAYTGRRFELGSATVRMSELTAEALNQVEDELVQQSGADRIVILSITKLES